MNIKLKLEYERAILWVFMSFLLFSVVFSYKNVSSCGVTVNDAYLAGETEVRINQDVSTDLMCFTIDADNLIFDCQGHRITGDIYTATGVNLLARTNVTLRNCFIEDCVDSLGLYSTVNSFFTNITINSSDDDSIYLSVASNNVFSGIKVYGGDRVKLRGNSTNNTFKNSYFSDGLFENIDFDDSLGLDPVNNYFYGNYLQNANKIDTNGLNNFFNNSELGNYYDDFDSSGCIESSPVVIDGCSYVTCTNKNYTIDVTYGIYDYNPVISIQGSDCPVELSNIESTPSSEEYNSIFPFSDGVGVFGVLFLVFCFLLV